MSRLSFAVQSVRSLVGSLLRSPKATLEALSLVPATARGIEFERNFKAPLPPEPTREAPSANPLQQYFDNHLEGPGLWKWSHYFEIYHRHFEKFRGQEVHVMEVGIYSGGSLGMWKSYFGSKCHIYGTDIEPACVSYKADQIEVFIGDQSDPAFWKRMRAAVPKVDILIDDGSHDPEHQRITLEEMLSHIQPGGVYLCEDIGGVSNSFAGFTAGLAQELNSAARDVDEFDTPVTPSSFQSSILSVTRYPYVTVIEKRAVNHGRFISRKHGTEWQPY